MFHKVSINYNGFGAGVSVPCVMQNRVFLKGWLANTAWRSVCRGSGAQELDSVRSLMTGCSEERPRAKNHGFELPCKGFEKCCKYETSCFTTFEEFPMAKVLCSRRVEVNIAKSFMLWAPFPSNSSGKHFSRLSIFTRLAKNAVQGEVCQTLFGTPGGRRCRPSHHQASR